MTQTRSSQPASLPILLSTILGSSLAFIDGSIVNVALPAIQKSLNASASELQWVVEAYLLLVAALILVSGALGDRYGYRRVFGLGVLIFTAASVACALAPNAAVLIAARAVQGVGGALLTPNSLALLSSSFDGEARGRAIGTWSALTSVAGVIGPLAGGWFVGSLSWHAAFWINVPLAAVVLFTLWRFVPEGPHKASSSRMPDLVGAGLATLGLGALVFGLIEAGAVGIAALESWLPLTLGAALLGAFVLWEARAPDPMLPLALFRSRTFSGANLLTFLLYGALGAVGYFVPLNLLQVQGYTPLEAGAALLPMTVLLALLSRAVGGWAERIGSRLFLSAGPVLVGLGFFWLMLPGVGVVYWRDILPATLLMGAGLGLLVSPLVGVVFGSVDKAQSGIASGINTAVARAAALVAIAGLGVVVSAGFSSTLRGQLERVEVPAGVRARLERDSGKLAATPVPQGVSAPQRAALERVVKESYVAGFRQMALWAALLALASGVFGWFFMPARAGEAGARAAAGSSD